MKYTCAEKTQLTGRPNYVILLINYDNVENHIPCILCVCCANW